MDPVFPPKQLTLVLVMAVTNKAGGCVKDTVPVGTQSTLSVSVTVYVIGSKPVAVAVSWAGVMFQE